jgi:hypothetical protein
MMFLPPNTAQMHETLGDTSCQNIQNQSLWLAHLPPLCLLTQQQPPHKVQLKNATAFHLQAKTTVLLAPAQRAQGHPKLITKATLGLWFQRAHVKLWNCQPAWTT